MPDLKAELSPNFSLNASGLLVPAGHNQMIVIADRSFGAAEFAPEFQHAGTTEGVRNAAAALLDLASSVPLEGIAYFMTPDERDERRYTSPERNEAIIESLGMKAVGLSKDGVYNGKATGFYDLIRRDPMRSSPSKAITCRTYSRFMYDCIVVRLGHSQTLD